MSKDDPALDQLYRFKTGAELAKYLRLAEGITPAEMKVARKYTAIRFITVRGVPKAHTSWMVVGSQRFQFGTKYWQSGTEAAWNCWMLAKALIKMGVS